MKTRYKVACWIGGCVLALSAALGLLAWLFFHTFYPAAPTADYLPPADLAIAQQQDLDYLRHYFVLNRAYSTEALEQAKVLYRDAQTRVKTDPFTPAEFSLAVMRMVALSDNGHSTVFKVSLSSKNNRIPCRFYHFSDGYYVVRARPACAALLGAKLVAIDDTGVDRVADRMYRYFLGPRNHYDQSIAPFLLESPELLHADGLANEADRMNLRVRMQDGSERVVTMPADAPGLKGPRVYSDAYLSPRQLDEESADWSTLLPGDALLPLFLRDYESPFHTAWWPDKHTYYVQLRSNMDEPGHPIGPFIERVTAEVMERQPRIIVLDMRLNQGGDFTTTGSFMKRLPTLTDSIEHVYVLTSAWTFSAGNVSLALVKEHGGNKVTVIGEPAGDRLQIWAEGGSLELPNSQLRVGYSTGYADYSKPCWGQSGCFWVSLLFPTHVTSFEPDVRVPFTFDDYVNLRDPVLGKALDLSRVAGAQTAQQPRLL